VTYIWSQKIPAVCLVPEYLAEDLTPRVRLVARERSVGVPPEMLKVLDDLL
jgi:hypothetical protein